MPSETSPGGPLALYIHLLGGFHVSWGSQAIGEDAWRLRRARTRAKVLALALSDLLVVGGLSSS